MEREIRKLLDSFDILVKAIRMAKLPKPEDVMQLAEVVKQLEAVVTEARKGMPKAGICVYRLPGFGYPELYVSRVLRDLGELSKAPG